MLKNKYITIISIIVIAVLALIFFNRGRHKVNDGVTSKINPYIGDIEITVTTTGVVEPQNRLEIKPSISGRIEEILVREGDKVKKGDILAYMSSTERAALVDAAGSKGTETQQYWEEVYKQSPIMSPIDGEVIVRSVEPGQTATTSDAVIVLSDRLIVSAQFDETDIGKVKVGQDAVIALDAYPDNKIKGAVDHIAYESELINNVNIYNVDILPLEIPDFFRSGMSANVEVIEQERRNVLLIPVEAITKEQGKAYVTVKSGSRNKIEKREVNIGLSDEKNVEIISGLSPTDIVFVQNQAYSLQKKQVGKSPFMPSH
jgi:macrolide-specific efflux system membrane fusion protein